MQRHSRDRAWRPSAALFLSPGTSSVASLANAQPVVSLLNRMRQADVRSDASRDVAVAERPAARARTWTVVRHVGESLVVPSHETAREVATVGERILVEPELFGQHARDQVVPSTPCASASADVDQAQRGWDGASGSSRARRPSETRAATRRSGAGRPRRRCRRCAPPPTQRSLIAHSDPARWPASTAPGSPGTAHATGRARPAPRRPVTPSVRRTA